MSETHSPLFNRQSTHRTVFPLCGACFAFFLLAIVLALKSETPPPIETQSVKVIEPSHPRRVDFTPPAVFETETFYRTIIDNDLFRPLGWTPPRPKEPYRLLGTLRFPIDANTPPKAILQSTAGDRLLIVSPGETLDASTEVVEIQSKQATLSTDEQRRTLKLTATHYLNPSRRSNRFAAQRQTPQRPLQR